MFNERYRGLPYCAYTKNNLNAVKKKLGRGGIMNAETYFINSNRIFWVNDFLFLNMEPKFESWP